jgi:hypothetical protein
VLLWIWRQLDGHLSGFEEAVLWETPRACAVLRRGMSS